MADIITDVEKLSVRADEINIKKERPLLNETILKIKETIRENSLTGLAANQIGVNKRIMCVNFNGDIRTFINPAIIDSKGFDLSKETCSSIPDKKYIRPRGTRVVLCYQTPMDKVETREFVGLAAKVVQHTLDHLDGILLSDIGLEIDGQFERATEENKAKIIKMYLDALDIRTKDAKEELSDDEDAKKMYDASKFIESVQKGEVIITPTNLGAEQLEEKFGKGETTNDSAD